MGDAGVRHPGHIVHLGQLAPGHLVPGHDLPVAVAHDLYIDPFVVGVGIAVVGPQEAADLHLLAGGGEGLEAVSGDADDLTGAQLVGVVVVQLVVGKGLEGDTAAAVVLPHQDRQTAEPVPGGDDLTLLCKEQQGEGAIDLLLGVQDAGDQVILLVDEGSGQLGGVDLSGAHGHKLMAVVGKIPLDQLLGVVDDAHRGDGVQSQVGPYQQGLWVSVADAADAAAPVEIGQILLKLGAEGGVLNGVDLPLEPIFGVMDDHAAPPGAQVGVIVHSKEDIQGHILV